MPKITIVTRTRDRAVLLERAIKSVQSQTMKDYVHVIVNDGGNEESVDKLVKAYSSPKSKIEVIHNEVSVGRTPALNKGIEYRDATYVAILDDDDSWDEKYLEITTQHLDKYNSMGVVVTSDYIVEEIKDKKIIKIDQERYRPDIREVSLYKQCVDNCAPTMAFVYRKSVYDELEGYDESLNVSEDWEFTLRFLMKYDIDFINSEKPLAFYHYRPGAVGSIGNSVFAGAEEHRQHMNMLANKLLRQDFRQEKLGLGYIVNSLRYDREILHEERSRHAHIDKRLSDIVSTIEENASDKAAEVQSGVAATEARLNEMIIRRTSIIKRIKNISGMPNKIMRKIFK